MDNPTFKTPLLATVLLLLLAVIISAVVSFSLLKLDKNKPSSSPGLSQSASETENPFANDSQLSANPFDQDESDNPFDQFETETTITNDQPYQNPF